MKCDYCAQRAVVIVRRDDWPVGEGYPMCAHHHIVNERVGPGWIVRRLDED